jgi:LDH2 family malate/lactate/ureidoglycolate dehydrogenase
MNAGVKAVIEQETVMINPDDLKDLARQLLEKAGVPRLDASRVADELVTCDLKGMESHGVRWLDIYLKRLIAGSTNPVTDLKIVREKGAILLVDAQNGLGQVALSRAVEMGIAKAKDAGSCVVGVRNSNHCGALGYYAEIATMANMAIMLTSNSAPLMAPWGGTTLSLGTNPICYGFPGDGFPVIVDMATSASARGKVFVAVQKGTKIPEGVALNKNGEPTTDAREAMEGILLPMCGPKGYGLALMADIMGGIMTGSNFGQGVPSLHGDIKHVQHIGHCAVIIDIDAFLPVAEFTQKMGESKRQLKSSKLAKGFTEIFLPGEIEGDKLRQGKQQGARITSGTWANLQDWAKTLKIN